MPTPFVLQGVNMKPTACPESRYCDRVCTSASFVSCPYLRLLQDRCRKGVADPIRNTADFNDRALNPFQTDTGRIDFDTSPKKRKKISRGKFFQKCAERT